MQSSRFCCRWFAFWQELLIKSKHSTKHQANQQPTMTGLSMIMSSESDSASLYTSLTSSMSIDEVSDRLAAMQHQESTSYQCCSYIDTNDARVSCSSPPRRRRRSEDSTSQRCTTSSRRQSITRDCRSRMARWCFQVTDYCKFQRETVSVAMQYLDRFLATSSPRAQLAVNDKKEFQVSTS